MLKLFFEILQKVYLGIPFWNIIFKKFFKKIRLKSKVRIFFSAFPVSNNLFLVKLIPNRANLDHFMPRWTKIPPQNSTQLNDNLQINNIKEWLTGLVLQNYHLIKQIASFSDIFGGLTFVSKKIFCIIFDGNFRCI